MSRRIIEGSYARLCGLRDSCPFGANSLPKSIGRDYFVILESLRKNVEDEFEGFDLQDDMYFSKDNDIHHFIGISIISRINQLIKYLELIHKASDKIVEIGSVFNSIKDSELRSRCGDLLSASGHFDRVINQATQVLEERIRQKVPDLKNETGMKLANRAINPEPAKSIIVIASNPSEQEGYASLFKGLMGAFRNPSHHKFLENVTREQALQICAFIDNMLAALESGQVTTS